MAKQFQSAATPPQPDLLPPPKQTQYGPEPNNVIPAVNTEEVRKQTPLAEQLNRVTHPPTDKPAKRNPRPLPATMRLTNQLARILSDPEWTPETRQIALKMIFAEFWKPEPILGFEPPK